MNCLPSLGAGVPVLGCLLPSGDAECSPQERLHMRTLIYQRALEAVIAFETGRFTSLDVPAGDQACQIRALQFCMTNLDGLDLVKKTIKSRLAALAELELAFGSLEKECENQVGKIEHERLAPLVEENRTIGKERGKAFNGISKKDPRYGEITQRLSERFSVVELKKKPILKMISELQQACRSKQKGMIEEDGLEMSVDPAAILVIRSYLVTLVKVDAIRKEMGAFIYQIHSNPKTLGKGEFVVPTPLLIETVERAKEAICLDSIDFVQKQAELIRCARLRKYVANPRVVESKGRPELPFFHMTRVIFQRAMAEKIPLLLKARNISSHPLEQESYMCSALLKSDGSTYKVSPVLPEDMQRRVIVIEGFSKKAIDVLKTSEYVENTLLKSGGILRLVDLNTAQHGQYTDQTESGKGMFRAIPGMQSDDEGTLISLFEEAVLKGFSLKNPDEFCVDHVFCDLLANQRAG